VWLDAPLEVRAARIGEREGKPVSQAREETRARADSEASRYEAYYGIDIDERSIYDLVVNTARWDPEGVLDVVLHAVETYHADGDEGQTPITGVDYDF
jgi:cytidylate kinase